MCQLKLFDNPTEEKEVKKEIKKPVINKCPAMPTGPFSVILADPPWRYEHCISKSRNIENKYPTMELEDIKGLVVPSDKDTVLFLWATAPLLPEALEVMRTWGFTYKTCAVWDKEIIGMGYWFRGQHELLLLGVKGDTLAPTTENRYSSVIKEKRTAHSKKPEIVYEMIENMFPNGKYLELFARQGRKNWTSWGNQVKQYKFF